MPAQPTTRWQISGYRFLVRRMEHALIKRDVRMLHDPMRAQSRSYAAGIIFAVLIIGGCALLAVLRPQEKIGQNQIVVAKDSGAMYAILNGTAHPVLNLSSARLATQQSKDPVIVKGAEIAKRPRGPLIGIPGAPATLPFDKNGGSQAWTVCDSARTDGSTELTTSVLAGDLKLGDRAAAVKNSEALLVRGREGAYLIYNGHRAKIDLADQRIKEALMLTGVEPRPVSEGLLNAIPQLPEIKRPVIPYAGSMPSPAIGGMRIGTVFRSNLGGSQRYWVVMRNGIQPISRPTADIITATTPQGLSDIPTVAPDIPAGANTLNDLPVQTYPTETPSILPQRDKPVACLSWKPRPGASEAKGGEIRAQVSLIAGQALPVDPKAKMVPLAQSRHDGTKADTVHLPPGTGVFVQSTGIEPNSERKDGLFYISDTGVRFGVKNAEAAKALGLQNPSAAPGQIIELLAPGATLGREEALIAHDGVAPDPSGVAVSAPK